VLFDPTIIIPDPTEAPYFITFNGTNSNPHGNAHLCNVLADNTPITGLPTGLPTNAPHFLVSVLSVLALLARFIKLKTLQKIVATTTQVLVPINLELLLYFLLCYTLAE